MTGAVVLAALAASCTAGGLEGLEVTAPSYVGQTIVTTPAEEPVPSVAVPDSPVADPTVIVESGPSPDDAQATETAFVPMSKPVAGTVPPAETAPVAIAEPADAAPVPLTEPAAPVVASGFAPPPPAQKKGFLASFFSQSPQEAPVMSAAPQAKPRPVVQLAAAPTGGNARAAVGAELPGVRTSSLFEIKRKNGLDDDDDVDLHEDEEMPLQLASAAGLARLAPNGLLKQRENVDVACLKPALVRMLKQIESRFGRKVMVTSGYRSPEHNKRVRGARRSMHMYCAAADIQVDGVTKWELATYVRAMQGRGGVGTYCHTDSVHVDVGPERDWNWRCRRRKG